MDLEMLGQNDVNKLDKEISNILNKEDDSLFNRGNFVEIIKEYVRDEEIPFEEEKYLKMFWRTISKTIKLTFLNEDDVYIFENQFEIIKLSYLMSLPEYEYNHSMELHLSNLKLLFVANIKRSVGVNQFVMNERSLQASSIRQNINSSNETFNSSSGGGSFISKLKNII